MKMLISALVLVTSSIVAGQRGSFAGTRPIGFPETPNRTTTTPDPLGNRFGEGIPEILPIEANGDRDLVDRLSKLPIDKQPFWFINWQSYDKHRKEPQTYPQRPNAFVDPIPINTNSGQLNNRFSAPVPGFNSTEPTVILNRFNQTTTPSQLSNSVSPPRNLQNNAYPIPHLYPSSNVHPNVNSNSNVYPSGNSNNNNPNLNVYPTGNPITNVYPTSDTNSNVYQTSNSHSDSVAVTKNGANFQTTQKYQWNSQYSASSNADNTNTKKYPDYYPWTDSYPQRKGPELF